MKIRLKKLLLKIIFTIIIFVALWLSITFLNYKMGGIATLVGLILDCGLVFLLGLILTR